MNSLKNCRWIHFTFSKGCLLSNEHYHFFQLKWSKLKIEQFPFFLRFVVKKTSSFTPSSGRELSRTLWALSDFGIVVQVSEGPCCEWPQKGINISLSPRQQPLWVPNHLVRHHFETVDSFGPCRWYRPTTLDSVSSDGSNFSFCSSVNFDLCVVPLYLHQFTRFKPLVTAKYHHSTPLFCIPLSDFDMRQSATPSEELG